MKLIEGDDIKKFFWESDGGHNGPIGWNEPKGGAYQPENDIRQGCKILILYLIFITIVRYVRLVE
ncbi:MAG: hypothetical protein P8184_08630 [Calditrichia bacterium]